MQLGYVVLYVPDVQATVAFYEAAFGLRRRAVFDNDFGEMETGATALGFVRESLAEYNGVTIRPNRLDDPTAGAEVAFLTEDPRAAFDRAVAAGAVAVAPPKIKPWGQTVAFVRDLNGFLVELCTPVVAP